MNIKHVLTACALALAAWLPAQAQPQPNAYAVDPLTSDMVLIYMGNNTRPAWVQSAFKPHVVHTYSDGSKPTWMFDSFLFLETTIEGKYLYNQTGGAAKAANQSLWERLFKFQLGITSKSEGMGALDKLIGTLKGTLGEPVMKHKIVMQIPTPQDGQTNWGAVDGRNLDFNNADDQQLAMKWALDKILELWQECAFENLELVGVYCIDETMRDVADRFRTFSEYIHEKGLKLYWIPYYTANSSKNEWSLNGVDVAYQQPNYYFDKNIYKTQLRAAIDDAKKFGLGVEMEFHPDAMWSYQRKSDETDLTVPSAASFYNRLKDYIDEFEAKGVFEESAIAYYHGNDGIQRFANSKTPEDHALMDRLAHIIDARHQKLAGVDDLVAGEKMLDFAEVGTGSITVKDSAPEARVYSINGTLLHTGCGTFHCQPGIYIATDGRGNTVKLAVR